MTYPITITLRQIKEHNPCKRGWETLLNSLGKTKEDDEPITFSYIAENNNVTDSLWCLRVIAKENHKEISLLAADIAERVLPIFEKEYPKDLKPRRTIEAIRDYVEGKITKEELKKIANDIITYKYVDNRTTYTIMYTIVSASNVLYNIPGYIADFTVSTATNAIEVFRTYAYIDCPAFATNVVISERQEQKRLIKKYLG